DQVIAAVEAGLSDLDDADADPRRAVIACWVRLEQAAAAAGTPRNVGDTPTELVTRLLTGHAVSAAVPYRLAEVYRLARYAVPTARHGAVRRPGTARPAALDRSPAAARHAGPAVRRAGQRGPDRGIRPGRPATGHQPLGQPAVLGEVAA